jgi:hypothetical protein
MELKTKKQTFMTRRQQQQQRYRRAARSELAYLISSTFEFNARLPEWLWFFLKKRFWDSNYSNVNRDDREGRL